MDERLIEKVFGVEYVTEFVVVTMSVAGPVDSIVGTKSGDRPLCLHQLPGVGLLLVKTLDDDEVLAAFSLLNLVSVHPHRYTGEDG